MKIINYFKDDRQELWQAQIAQYEWRAAKFLAQLLTEGSFHSTLGQGTLYLLAEGEQCVSDIAEKVDLSQSAISHQLRFLKQMQLIRFRRDGKNVLYSLADDHVKTILEMGLEHVLE